MTMTLYDAARLGFARDSLAGLSVGDALGAQYFMVGRRFADLAEGRVPPPVWEWTDDTEMACSVYRMLADAVSSGQARASATAAAGERSAATPVIDRERLAYVFADRCEPNRGYGAGAFTTLRRIRTGTPWRVAAAEAFNGEGSCGNGAAMRVAPVGAYFADSPRRAATEAAKSAEITHAHPEGIAGAVAVAVAASEAASARLAGQRPPAGTFITAVLENVPASSVRKGLSQAHRMIRASVAEAAYELGNGSQVLAQDTVPFTVWVAARFLADYPAAITACVEAGGDADTTSAIVGGIVASHTGLAGIPADWLAAREPLPPWTFAESAAE